MTLVSQFDRFDASWTAIERKEGFSLKELRSIATVRGVGGSTRIEAAFKRRLSIGMQITY